MSASSSLGVSPLTPGPIARRVELLRAKPELGREMLDAGASEAFAASVLSLPLDQTHAEPEIDYVIAQVRAFFRA